MATIDSGERSSLAGVRVTGQTLLMVGFTLVETVTLGFWLTLVAGASVISVAAAVGLGVLILGLVVEHVLADATVNGLTVDVLPSRQTLGVSGFEALLWTLWLGVAQRLGGVDGILAAGALLAVLLVVQHTIADNALRGVAPLETVVDLGTAGFSLVEAVGATVWLLLVFEGEQFSGLLGALGLAGVGPSAVGLATLAVCLLVEHDIAVALAREG